MIYTIEKSNLIINQLKRFTSGYSHHLAGQYSNIDFWLYEVLQARKTINEYNSRFKNIANAQKEWVENHGTKVYDFCSICMGKCEFANGKPITPKRFSGSELKKTRIQLIDSAYYFLIRCYRSGFLNDIELKQKCDFIGTSIDPNDLK